MHQIRSYFTEIIGLGKVREGHVCSTTRSRVLHDLLELPLAQ